MIKKTVSTQRLEPVLYFPLPNGEADIFLRKNVVELLDKTGDVYYEADEAYMRGEIPLYEIEADFDAAYQKAAAFTQRPGVERTELERIQALEEENAGLEEQLNDARLALCELYEMIGG